MKAEIITSHEELINLTKDGNFFGLCIAVALNLGYRNTIKEKKEVKFSIGDYEISFDYEQMCFIMNHKIYFARIITAYLNGVWFVGDDENEIIKDLLKELNKEK